MVKTEPNSSAAFNQSEEYRKISPLGKIPIFEGANGFVLSEVIAIAIYGMYILEKFFSSFYFMMKIFIFLQLSLAEKNFMLTTSYL